MFVLRYLPGTDLRDRHHSATEGRFETWLDAENVRHARPKPELLEVLEREEERR